VLWRCQSDGTQVEQANNECFLGMADSPPQFEDRGQLVLAVTIALLVASSFFIVLRFISRIGIVKRVSADDYAIVVAWVSRCRVAHGVEY